MKLSQLIFDRSVVTRAAVMAVIVGSVLVLINHGECIYTGQFNGMCGLASAMTFVVPYTVSTISSVLAIWDKKSGSD